MPHGSQPEDYLHLALGQGRERLCLAASAAHHVAGNFGA